MARRLSLLKEAWANLIAAPAEDRSVGQHGTLTPEERDAVAIKRTPANRLGFALTLIYMRFPGRLLKAGEDIPLPLLDFVADQVDADPEDLKAYFKRGQTRREHMGQIMTQFGYVSFNNKHARNLILWLKPKAGEETKQEILLSALIGELRARRILIPSQRVVETMVWLALRRAERARHLALTSALSERQIAALNDLLTMPEGEEVTRLVWLKSAPISASANSLKHIIARLDVLREIELPDKLKTAVSTSALDRMADEGLRMTVQNLGRLKQPALNGVLVAVCLRLSEKLTDQALDMFDRLLGKAIRKAEFRSSAKAAQMLMDILGSVETLKTFSRSAVEASGGDIDFAGLRKRTDWEVIEAATSQIEDAFGEGKPNRYAELIERYQTARKFAPLVITSFEFHGAPSAASLLRAVSALKTMYQSGKRSLSPDPPTDFIRKLWRSFVFPAPGKIDRRAYELCTYFELRDRIRAGDVWVAGSKRHSAFEARLIPQATFDILKSEGELPIAAPVDVEDYLAQRKAEISAAMIDVAAMAEAGSLPDAVIRDGILSISPIKDETPGAAKPLSRIAYAQVPQIKIPDLLTEVNGWTGFADCFRHLRTGRTASDQGALFAALLADGINLGISRMAASSQGLTARQIGWAHDWHLREETYAEALARVIDGHRTLELSKVWGDGTTSSSDGQFFRAGGRGEASADINMRYGTNPGVKFYTHVSDQYGPFSSTVISATASEAPFVIDGLLRDRSGLSIEEHYVDTGGATDHVFALCYLLGFRFAPRLRNFKGRKIYPLPGMEVPTILTPLVGGSVKTTAIVANWSDILRLATSIQAGTTTASSILKSLAAYPRQNGLAVAMREIGRIERTRFALEWMRDLDLRHRTNTGLVRGEARNALARGIFFNQLGELRDRSFEHQLQKASGLNFLVASIILWNTKYLEASIKSLRADGMSVPDDHLKHIAPLGSGHIGLTGDYVWDLTRPTDPTLLRPLRKPDRSEAA